MIYNVILSGGIGSRLWPLSRKSAPKQYLPIIDGKSMFELTLDRNKAISDGCIIVGNKDNHHLSQQAVANGNINNYAYIVEAAPRNTAAAIAFACFGLAEDDIVIVTPADHMITGGAQYQRSIEEGIALAAQDVLVTFGIRPSKPETGYGYIERSDNRVLSFREKPDLETAQGFLKNGSFLWNSGMFCFKAGVYIKELQQHAPTVYKAAYKTWSNRSGTFMPVAETLEIPAISVDYAVMERSANLRVIEADFVWSDLGSFDSIWDYKENISGNDKAMPNLVIATQNKHVEFIGLENLILVETNDAILVIPRNQSQKVKEIYDRLELEKPALLQ